MFLFSSIQQYHSLLQIGATTCVQAVQHYIDTIKNNGHLNAFIEVYEKEALERAAALDKQSRKGKLHGVVLGIKDNICYKGHKSSAASKILESFVSVYSATVVERLLAEGAIIIGRQNCDEFGMGSTNENSAYGSVLNPNDNSRVAGGSSGGSAAAVKAGLCMASLGSDTGGSVRLPADFCGVVGFKPAYGNVSRYGLIAYASSFDVIGVLANSVADASTIYEVIGGRDEFDSTSSTTNTFAQPEPAGKKYKIAYFQEWVNHPSIDPEISAAITQRLQLLKDEGHRVEAVSFSLTDYIVPAYYILTTAEASSNLARYDGVRYGIKTQTQPNDLPEFYRQNRSEGFGPEVRRRIMLGSYVLSAGYYDAYFTKAQQVRRLLVNQTKRIFQDFDFILAPNAPSIAYPLEQQNANPLAMYMGDIFTVFANLTGVPAISLPVFKHSSNLPFGLQVLCAEHNEVSLQRFSHQLMQQ
ncbi:MAG: Asp-tRNA(Asn)/Glu-tRNA(Gln) amidotransferase subunit GatA [Bacteroidota bacterium]